jgi:alpha-ketoglutarate-dependent taurine dioxygenase
MGVSFRPLTDAIGAEIQGVDLAAPIDGETFDRIHGVWLERTILLFRRQQMSPDQQIAFTRRLGTLEMHTLPQYTLADHPEIFVVSNVMEEGRPIGAPKSGRHWHSDSQYLPRPSAGSLLYAREVPLEGGDTLFTNMFAAYEALPEETKKQIAGLRVLHSRVKAYPLSYPDRAPMTEEEKARVPDVIHPLVRTHPETGRKALFVGGNVAWEIVGMPLEEGQALIRELRDFATQERFVYRHHWEVGDAILWDNRSTMHCATAFDEERYRRVMHRTTVEGDEPI